MARRCIFCGETNLTREHARPEWILKKQDFLGISQYSHGDHVRTLIGPDSAIKFRRVCSTCNNGWMSDLENATKPVVEPLMIGQPTCLGTIEQRQLGTWLTKTAMVFGCLQKDEDRFFTLEECSHLRLNMTPPNPVKEILIGHYCGTELTLTSPFHGLSGTHEHLGFEAVIFTFLVGQFVGQILAVKNEPRGSKFIEKVSPNPDAVIHIGTPAVSVEWPPPISFDDEGGNSFKAFAERGERGIL